MENRAGSFVGLLGRRFKGFLFALSIALSRAPFVRSKLGFGTPSLLASRFSSSRKRVDSSGMKTPYSRGNFTASFFFLCRFQGIGLFLLIPRSMRSASLISILDERKKSFLK